MSEYKPITGELRNSMTYDITTAPNGVSVASIDTVEFVNICDSIDSVHAALEVENERLREQYRDGWIELPKDADGDYIHVGDMIKLPNCKREEVRFMTINGAGWLINEAGWLPCKVGHSKPDTWERIIEDAMGRYSDADADALVARCKALAGEDE